MMSMRTMIFGCALSLAIAPLSWGQSASAKVAQRIGAILDPAGKDGGVISSPQSRVGPAKIERPEATLPLADAVPEAIDQSRDRGLLVDRHAIHPRSPVAARFGVPVTWLQPRPLPLTESPGLSPLLNGKRTALT